MEPTESATDDIQRLSVKLSAVVRKNGISEEQVDETILTHFKSTWNDEKISNIVHIKYDTSNPPTLQELMREVKMADEELNARFSKRKDPPTQRPRITRHMQGARTEAKDPDGISALREEMSSSGYAGIAKGQNKWSAWEVIPEPLMVVQTNQTVWRGFATIVDSAKAITNSTVWTQQIQPRFTNCWTSGAKSCSKGTPVGLIL